MRIVLDLQGAQTESRFRGIGRYSLSLAKAIVRNKGEHDVLVVLNGNFPETIEPIRSEFYGELAQEKILVWHSPNIVCEKDIVAQWPHEAAELIREAFLESLNPDIIHIMSLFEGFIDGAISSIGRLNSVTPVSVTFYDLIPLINKEQYLFSNARYEKFYLKKLSYLKRASLLLSISASAKQEGEEHLKGYSKDIVNVSTAIEKDFASNAFDSEQKQSILNRFKISKPFVLYTGGADKRKNLHRLIASYGKLSAEIRSEHQLVFVGKMPDGDVYELRKTAAAEGVKKDEFIIAGFVSDAELVVFYQLCRLYVFPSLHEGFGLPVLEAMSCGAAVIASNNSSLPEVVGNVDALFDPESQSDVTKKMALALTDDDFHKHLIDQGGLQAKKFLWDKSGQLAISAFEMIEAKNQHDNNAPTIHDLIHKLVRVLPHDLSDQKCIHLADNLSRNHCTSAAKQLFVDVSELVRQDARTGIQRVVRSLLKQLLENSYEEFQVEPVYATQEQGYRYARKFTNAFLGKEVKKGADELIEYKAGDLFLGLDLQSHVVIANRDLYQKMRREGVCVRFVVYDLLCILMPDFFPVGAKSLHSHWLDVVAESDGAICISKSVSDELAIWLEGNGPKRYLPFKNSWFHLGADIDSSIPSKGLPEDIKEQLINIYHT